MPFKEGESRASMARNAVGALMYYALRARYKHIITLCEGDGRNKLRPLHPLVPVVHAYFTPFSLFERYCPQGMSLHVVAPFVGSRLCPLFLLVYRSRSNLSEMSSTVFSLCFFQRECDKKQQGPGPAVFCHILVGYSLAVLVGGFSTLGP